MCYKPFLFESNIKATSSIRTTPFPAQTVQCRCVAGPVDIANQMLSRSLARCLECESVTCPGSHVHRESAEKEKHPLRQRYPSLPTEGARQPAAAGAAPQLRRKKEATNSLIRQLNSFRVAKSDRTVLVKIGELISFASKGKTVTSSWRRQAAAAFGDVSPDNEPLKSSGCNI